MGRTRRKDIDNFIWEKLPNILTDTQKKNKIKNLLQELRLENRIHSPEYGYWEKV